MSSNQKPTLEDLLKLKRAERPSDAAWAEFDADLKRKLLCTIVEKESVWQRYLPSFSFGRRAVYASVSVVALVAAVFVPFYAASWGASGLSSEGEVSVSKCTPLPNIPHSFADNILASEKSSIETPVSAPMNLVENPSVRYVNSQISASGASVF